MVTSSQYFNPLSPHGERHVDDQVSEIVIEFQSTLPAWGETRWGYAPLSTDLIFQSTLPAWGETCPVM